MLRAIQNGPPTLTNHALEGRICAYAPCGRRFEAPHRARKFCSDTCRWRAWKEKREGTATINEHPQEVLGILLVMTADKKNLPCGFCHRTNRVDLSRDGRQKIICRCGARYFRRYRRCRLPGGPKSYRKERGWKKGKREVLFI